MIDSASRRLLSLSPLSPLSLSRYLSLSPAGVALPHLPTHVDGWGGLLAPGVMFTRPVIETGPIPPQMSARVHRGETVFVISFETTHNYIDSIGCFLARC